jgi:hypothetical protein
VNRVGKLALVAGILAIALAVPIATAHLIYVYEAYVTLKPQTPVVWLPGPEASEVSLSLTNKTNVQIQMTVPITNSSETYVYQALELKVNAGSPTLYVDSCSYTYSGPPPTAYSLTSVEIIVYPTTASPSSPLGTISITPPSATSPPGTPCTTSGSVTLTPGTYYVDFKIEPTLPIPYGAGSATLTIDFGLSNQTPTVTVPTP